MQSSKIIIAGFSGAGKSAFLNELKEASPADWKRFSDLDSEVVLQSGHESIAEIVEAEGWEKFRKLEFLTLMDWINLPGNGVLALGGGSLTEESLEVLQSRSDVKLIYIHSDFETCWARIKESAEVRPLVKQGKEELRALYEKRSVLFQKIPIKIENSHEAYLQGLAQEFWSHLDG